MQMRLPLVAMALAMAPVTEQARASSSGWHRAEGGAVRLVTTGVADKDGVLHGALQIQLKPGWKTYWLDPGDAGVPPTLDATGSTNVKGAELSFPAPHRFDDGFAEWAGYDESVSFAVALSLVDPGQPANLKAEVFLGICETICVPVQATLSLDSAADPDNADDAALVQAAVDALPQPARADFGVTVVSGIKDAVRVEAAFSGDPGAVDFFLAGSNGYYFGPPERQETDGKLFFSVPVLEHPDAVPTQGGLRYTLTTGAGAVSGVLSYPEVR